MKPKSLRKKVLEGWTIADWENYFTPDNVIECVGGFRQEYWDKWSDGQRKIRITIEELPKLPVTNRGYNMNLRSILEEMLGHYDTHGIISDSDGNGCLDHAITQIESEIKRRTEALRLTEEDIADSILTLTCCDYFKQWEIAKTIHEAQNAKMKGEK